MGTLGHSPVVDRLVRDGKLDVRGVAGRWEAYLLGRRPVSLGHHPRWLTILRKRGWAPQPAETPHEFATNVAGRMGALSAVAALSDLPTHTARLYYQVRYGGRPLDKAEEREVIDRLNHLDRALGDKKPPG